MKYRVNLKKTEESYSVWVLGLPGCWSQGKSEIEALEMSKTPLAPIWRLLIGKLGT